MEKIAQNLINKIGIKQGDTLLDFGCGTGTYTIPAANVVGENGEVTAIDSDENVLDFLKNKAKTCGLTNIKVIQSSIDYSLPFKDETFDIILLYDIIHHYYFTPETRKLFLGENIEGCKTRCYHFNFSCSYEYEPISYGN